MTPPRSTRIAKPDATTTKVPPAPAQVAPEAGPAKGMVGQIPGFEAQAAALDPKTPADPLSRWAAALNATKSPTEKKAVYASAEAAGIDKKELDAKAAELHAAELKARGVARGDAKTAGEAEAKEEGEAGAEGEAAAEEKEEKDPAKLRSALEKKLGAAKTMKERQAIYEAARAKGIALGGSQTTNDAGAVTGLTAAGETTATKAETGGRSAYQGHGVATIGGGQVAAAGNVTTSSSQLEGQSQETQVGGGVSAGKDGALGVTAGARRRDVFDPNAGAAADAPKVDGTSTKATTHASVGYDTKKGVSLAAGHATEEARKDGAITVTDSSSNDFSYAEGQVGWQGAHATEVKDEVELTAEDKAALEKERAAKRAAAEAKWQEEAKQARAEGREVPAKPEPESEDPPTASTRTGMTAGLSLGAKGVTANLGGERTTSTPELPSTAGQTTTTRGGVGYSSEKGVTAQGARERVMTADGYERRDASSATFEKGTLTLGTGSTETYEQDDESSSSTARSASVAIGKDSVVVARSGTTTDKAADGSARARTAGVSADLAKGKLGGNVGTTTTDADGKVVSGVSASGGIDLAVNGRLEGANAAVSATRGPATVVVSGEWKYTIDEPKQVDGAWVVTYTKSLSGGGTLGGKSASGYGVSVGGSAATTSTGERHFATKAEAEAFRTKGPSEAGAPTTVDGARSLAVGDRSSSTTSRGGELGASGVIEGLQVGGKLQIGQSHSVTVMRVDANKVQVEVVDADTLGGEASLGTFGVSMRGGGSRTLTQGVVLEFDLSTATGAKAFETFRATGVARKDTPVVARTSGRTDTRSSGVGLGVADISSQSTVDQSTTVDTAHNKVERASGTESSGIDMGYFGKSSTSTALHTREVNDTKRSYGTVATVDSSSASSASHDLSRATGTHQSVVGDGASKGQWTVTSQFSDSQIQTLCDKIKSDRFNYHALIYQAGYGEDLVAAVKGAGGDLDAVRLALATFVSRTGSRGLELMRETIGGKFDYDLGLADDENFKGAAGRVETERQIADFKARLAAPTGDKGALVGDIAKVLTQQQERMAAIADPAQYPELPTELRASEVGKARAIVATLTKLRDDAVAAVQAAALGPTPAPTPTRGRSGTSANATTAAPGQSPSTADKAKTGATPARTAVETKAPAPETPAQIVAREWAAVTAAQAAMEKKRATASGHRTAARTSRWVQIGGAYAFQYSALHDYGERSFFGDGRLAGDYENANGIYKAAVFSWGVAETTDRELERIRTEAAVGMSTAPAAWVGRLQSTIAGAIAKLADLYAEAGKHFAEAEAVYQSIRAQILAENAGNKNKYFLGYGHELGDGANVP